MSTAPRPLETARPQAIEPLTIEQALQLPPTVSVSQAAALLGISRTAAHEAIHRKEIPSLSIGRRVVVPTRPLLALLGLDPQAGPAGRTSSPRAPAAQACGLAECLGRLGQALLRHDRPPSSPI
jgi:excisionase family DNA binding protein